ncbi:hypothetical protein C8J56DRAFT_1017791 [Mycena floridula]|nr:hypothetical protein C8J56DRAFT_1017791 [Mycena floridula]
MFSRALLSKSRPLHAVASRSLRPTALSSILVQRRGEATSVSSRPASQSIPQYAQNVKEEVGNVAGDLAKAVAGSKGQGEGGFKEITEGIASQVPQPAMVLGLAGTIPYVGTGLTTVYLARNAGLAASGTVSSLDPGVALTIFDQALNLQVTYGAVMLSFLGAIHWGFEFAGYGGQKGAQRLMLGAAPLFLAWPTLALQPVTALVVQWFAFTGLWAADAKATSWGWTPKWYSQYRFYLSILTGACILGSLAGVSYYGPVAGHGFVSHDLQEIKEERKKNNGPVEAKVEDPAEGFVKIHKRDIEAEKEAEKKAQEEAQEKK